MESKLKDRSNGLIFMYILKNYFLSRTPDRLFLYVPDRLILFITVLSRFHTRMVDIMLTPLGLDFKLGGGVAWATILFSD